MPETSGHAKNIPEAEEKQITFILDYAQDHRITLFHGKCSLVRPHLCRACSVYYFTAFSPASVVATINKTYFYFRLVCAANGK